MCYQQSLRSACAYAQSDQSLCLSLEYSMSVQLLTEHHLRVLSLKEAAQACLSLHLSKCHIVGNHVSRLKSQQTLLVQISYLQRQQLDLYSASYPPEHPWLKVCKSVLKNNTPILKVYSMHTETVFRARNYNASLKLSKT